MAHISQLINRSAEAYKVALQMARPLTTETNAPALAMVLLIAARLETIEDALIAVAEK